MTYDFTTVIEPSRIDAIALDSPPGQPVDGFDIIPMWVADMNFATSPAVTEAMSKRIAHPTFGYFNTRSEYFDGILRWQKTHNNAVDLTADCISYQNGVLAGVVSALDAIQPRDKKILIHAPTYTGFIGSITTAGYTLVYSDLIRDDKGIWRMDLADMEAKIVAEHIDTALLCSPHNPTGRVWEREELVAVMALYEKHNVTVISDEIWSDLILDGNRYTAPQTVSEYARQHTVSLYAPTKTFNLAGIIGAYSIIYNPELRAKVVAAANRSHQNRMNVLSMYAQIGGCTPESEDWLRQLRTVLSENARFAVSYIRSRFDGVWVAEPQGTYLLFLDCTEWCKKTGTSMEELLKFAYECGVMVNDGRPFFHGKPSLRINLALPAARVEEAFRRLEKYVFCR